MSGKIPEKSGKSPGKVPKTFSVPNFFFEENKREPKIEASTKKGEVCF